MIDRIERCAACVVSRETAGLLARYVDLVLAESRRQNLIAKSTLDDIWLRHVEDSAQLVALARDPGSWVDVGSGAGFPGMIVAILTGEPVTLVEPRKLRAEFLQRACQELGLENVTIVAAKAEAVHGKYDRITARAVAPAVELLRMTAHFAHSRSRFLLMKGRSAQKELEDVRTAWQGDFQLVTSCTDHEAAIIVAERVRRRGCN